MRSLDKIMLILDKIAVRVAERRLWPVSTLVGRSYCHFGWTMDCLAAVESSTQPDPPCPRRLWL